MSESSLEIRNRISSPEKITEKLSDTAESVRDYSRLQVGFWKMLPMLGLETQGRGGYSDQARWLYEYGVYRVNSNDKASGMIGTYVDCESGEILRLGGALKLDSLATDEQVIEAWMSRGGRTFDAESIVASYFDSVDRTGPETTDGKTAAQAIEWRREIAGRLGLKAVYQRLVVDNATN